LKMHRIHAYPAKFPAFITTKALSYAKRERIKVKRIADVFCGCGTVAFEAKRNDVNFWGCDINPVATLIARVKSHNYQQGRLKNYFDSIISTYSSSYKYRGSYNEANERIKHWYERKPFHELSRLKYSIDIALPKRGKYRLFFFCAFSNILKSASRWLTKSIKPQIDPEKEAGDVLTGFKDQCLFMMNANHESDAKEISSTEIVTRNFLDDTIAIPKVDMIITSPPYVISYEYADLHQLSTLWLDFADDYRDLRNGSLGSLYHVYKFEKELKRLNDTGSKIVFRLLGEDKNKAKYVAKYFLDMQKAIHKCYEMLSEKGLAVFVIGNTEYRSVRIDNAKHLAESMQSSGFKKIYITKRKISKKILTPYRDDRGCFTTDKNGRQVYAEEFILIGRK